MSEKMTEEKSRLEIIAIGTSVAALFGWTAFWILQVRAVVEMLEMAYG